MRWDFYLYVDIIFYRLKELVPSLSVNDNVTQLDVILEAIRYIASLRSQLERRKGEEERRSNEVGRRQNKANQNKNTPPPPPPPGFTKN